MDIDLDFEDARREEVIEYCRQKYGYERVSRIITFGRMAAKNAVKDVGRTLGVPYSELDKVTKIIPNIPAKHQIYDHAAPEFTYRNQNSTIDPTNDTRRVEADAMDQIDASKTKTTA